MSTHVDPELARLYDTDETAWLDAMAQRIREGRTDELDFDNLREYLASMARRDRREVARRLRVLLAHRLKWDHQPEKRTRSWLGTLVSQQSELVSLLESATLRGHAEEAFQSAYFRAVKQASVETGLPEAEFPMICAYTIEQILQETVVM